MTKAQAMKRVMTKLIKAHRDGDEEGMRKWSQEKQRVKKLGGCETCGVLLGRGTYRFCLMHTNVRRFYQSFLPRLPKLQVTPKVKAKRKTLRERILPYTYAKCLSIDR